MITSKQLKSYKEISNLSKKMKFYLTNDEDGREVSRDSIFVKSYELLCENLKEIRPNPQRRYKTHILLVGFSIQPIILSLCALQAENLIFLYSQDTKDKCDEIADWVDKIKNSLKINWDFTFIGEDDWHKDQSFYLIDSSNPGDTYKRINEIIAGEEKKGTKTSQIALDITGGKKTMVSGAFTASAISDIDTYYVDFRTYEADGPQPGTEFLSKLENPIKIFIAGLEDIFDVINNGKLINYTSLSNNNKEFLDYLVTHGYLEKREEKEGRVLYTAKKTKHNESI